MEEEKQQDELEGLLSTYQWVTVGRVLSRYGLSLPETAVMTLLRAKTSFYYQLLRIPLTHILNGIILGQAHEYQLFLQKLFVDYLISGEADRSEEEQGQDTRESIETQRQSMLALTGEFEAAERAHENLITESQQVIMAFMDEFIQILEKVRSQFTGLSLNACHDLFLDAEGFQIQEAAWTRFEKASGQILTAEQRTTLQALFQDLDTSALLADYGPKVEQSRATLHQFRKQFYEKIAETQEELDKISAYPVDEHQEAENLARLKFDPDIGVEDKVD